MKTFPRVLAAFLTMLLLTKNATGEETPTPVNLLRLDDAEIVRTNVVPGESNRVALLADGDAETSIVLPASADA
jgi:hypothetical protein